MSARDQVAKEAGERSIQVMRYVRLTETDSRAFDMVDEKKIAFNQPANSLLKPDRQQMLVETMDYEQATFSLSGSANEKVQPGREIVRRCDACHHVRGKRVIWIK